jgi:hypothetical protein
MDKRNPDVIYQDLTCPPERVKGVVTTTKDWRFKMKIEELEGWCKKLAFLLFVDWILSERTKDGVEIPDCVLFLNLEFEIHKLI